MTTQTKQQYQNWSSELFLRLLLHDRAGSVIFLLQLRGCSFLSLCRWTFTAILLRIWLLNGLSFVCLAQVSLVDFVSPRCKIRRRAGASFLLRFINKQN